MRRAPFRRRRALSALLVLVALSASLAQVPAQAFPGYDFMDSVAVDGNAWVAWKVTLPANAETESYVVTFDGFDRSGRVRGAVWILRPPYTQQAGFGTISGFTNPAQVRARVEAPRAVGYGAEAHAGSVYGSQPESFTMGGTGLRPGDNIIVAVVAGAEEPMWGTMGLWTRKSNGPVPVFRARSLGESFYDTEYDLATDEAYVRTSTSAIWTAWIHDAWLHRDINGRLFGWFDSGVDTTFEGPEQGDGCGGDCRFFDGTRAGRYTFRVPSDQAAGLWAGSVDFMGADVDLEPLIAS